LTRPGATVAGVVEVQLVDHDGFGESPDGVIPAEHEFENGSS
jgi:hypothetical protein